MTTYRFREIGATGIRRGKCSVCGRSGRRKQTFTMTVNPFNKNQDGSVRTPNEVNAVVHEKASSWAAEAFVHPSCEVQP